MTEIDNDGKQRLDLSAAVCRRNRVTHPLNRVIFRAVNKQR